MRRDTPALIVIYCVNLFTALERPGMTIATEFARVTRVRWKIRCSVCCYIAWFRRGIAIILCGLCGFVRFFNNKIHAFIKLRRAKKGKNNGRQSEDCRVEICAKWKERTRQREGGRGEKKRHKSKLRARTRACTNRRIWWVTLNRAWRNFMRNNKARWESAETEARYIRRKLGRKQAESN